MRRRVGGRESIDITGCLLKFDLKGGFMDTMSAFVMGQANQGKEMMVFDWVKAAHLIKKRKPTIASAGLRNDWEYTGGEIWKDGKPVPKKETYIYLASTWAVPELDLDGEVVECYVMQGKRKKWHAKTYWPKETKKILK